MFVSVVDGSWKVGWKVVFVSVVCGNCNEPVDRNEDGMYLFTTCLWYVTVCGM